MLHRRAAQGTQTPRRGEKTQPIFRTIFGAMMLVLVAEILLLVISIYVTNVGGRLNQNAKDMLAMQVRNRVGYMQDLMQNAQDLTDLSDYIDRATLSMVNTGRLDLDALNTDRAARCLPPLHRSWSTPCAHGLSPAFLWC